MQAVVHVPGLIIHIIITIITLYILPIFSVLIIHLTWTRPANGQCKKIHHGEQGSIVLSYVTLAIEKRKDEIGRCLIAWNNELNSAWVSTNAPPFCSSSSNPHSDNYAWLITPRHLSLLVSGSIGLHSLTCWLHLLLANGLTSYCYGWPFFNVLSINILFADLWLRQEQKPFGGLSNYAPRLLSIIHSTNMHVC